MNTDTLRAMAKLMERESDEPDDLRGLRAKTVHWAADEINRLEKECFALAAGACHDGYGDEYGNWRCRYQDQIAALTSHDREGAK